MTSFPIISRETPVVVFTNPFAGRGRSTSQIVRAKKAFEHAGIPVEFQASAELGEFRAKVSEVVVRNQRLLLALGGDGSFHHLVNATFGEDVVVGLLPAGGGNDLAMALRLKRDFSDIPQLIKEQKTVFLDALRVRTSDGGERLCVVNAGAGLDAEAARLAGTRYRAVYGRLRYVLSVLQAFRRFIPCKMQIEFADEPGRTVLETLLFAGTLNAQTCGGGIRVAPNADVTDGLLDLVMLKKLNVLEVLRILPELVFRGQVRTGRLTTIQTKKVKISSEEPCLFQGDGEILGHTPVEIEVIPRAIRVLGAQ